MFSQADHDDEIRRLIEERRNTVKGVKHQLKELSNKNQKVHQRQKKNITTRNGTADSGGIQRHQKYIMLKNLEGKEQEKSAQPESEKRKRRDNNIKKRNCKCVR